MGAKRVSKQSVTVSQGNAIEVLNTSGTALFAVDNTGAITTLTAIVAGSTSLTLGAGSVAQQFGVVSSAATTVGAVIRGAASQTADALQVQNSAGTVLASTTAAGIALKPQPTPIAKSASATLLIADLLTGIVTATSATAVALTLPTGTLSDGGFAAIANDQSFDWSVINLGSSVGAVTMTAGTAHTYVGNATVAINTSAQFRSRRTAATTWVTYRIS